MMNEFDSIARYFAPLTEGFPGADRLRDDAALLCPPEGKRLVVTTDTMHEGVHFLGDETPAELARKLLRVNLSDLAAKGARPWCYLLNLGVPAGYTQDWIAGFADGLHEDQHQYGIALAGGDSTNTAHGISLTLTAFGLVGEGGILRRSTARAGDLIYVTGTIGDAYLGLRAFRNELEVSAEDEAYFKRAYRLPDPPVAFGLQGAKLASAGMDISDGLAQDLGHLCAASDCGARIYAPDVPLSQAARKQNVALELLLSGGDDYQLLLTMPPAKKEAAEEAAASAGVRLTCIGAMTENKAVEFCDAHGRPLEFSTAGWQHRFG